MASWVTKLRSQFKGFGNVVTGIIIGAGLVKIYYETTDKSDGNAPAKKEIEDIIAKNDNRKQGRHLRTVSLRTTSDNESKMNQVDSSRHGGFDTGDDNLFKHGLPQRSSDYLRYKNHVFVLRSSEEDPEMGTGTFDTR